MAKLKTFEEFAIEKQQTVEHKGTKHKEEEVEEGNAFGDAVRKAKEAGDSEFEFEGETFKVEEQEEIEEDRASDIEDEEVELGKTKELKESKEEVTKEEKVEESVLNEASGQAMKELMDLAILLKDEVEANYVDIGAGIDSMDGKKTQALEKRILTLNVQLTKLTNAGFQINKKK